MDPLLGLAADVDAIVVVDAVADVVLLSLLLLVTVEAGAAAVAGVFFFTSTPNPPFLLDNVPILFSQKLANLFLLLLNVSMVPCGEGVGERLATLSCSKSGHPLSVEFELECLR